MKRAETDERNICIENETDRQRQRQTETDAQRQDREKDRDIKRERERERRDREIQINTNRQADKQTDRVTGTERDTCIDTRIIDKWTVGWMGKKPHRETDRQSVSHETTVVPDRDSRRSIHT